MASVIDESDRTFTDFSTSEAGFGSFDPGAAARCGTVPIVSSNFGFGNLFSTLNPGMNMPAGGYPWALIPNLSSSFIQMKPCKADEQKGEHLPAELENVHFMTKSMTSFLQEFSPNFPKRSRTSLLQQLAMLPTQSLPFMNLIKMQMWSPYLQQTL